MYDIQLQKQVKIIKCTIDQPYAETSSTTITFTRTTTNIVQCPFFASSLSFIVIHISSSSSNRMRGVLLKVYSSFKYMHILQVFIFILHLKLFSTYHHHHHINIVGSHYWYRFLVCVCVCLFVFNTKKVFLCCKICLLLPSGFL